MSMIYFGKINSLAACVALEPLLYPNAFRNAALAARKMQPHLSHLNARKYSKRLGTMT